MKQIEKSIALFEQIFKATHLNASHISLYITLYQLWKQNRFKNPFQLYRHKTMDLSKIKSITTYHSCIKELEDSGFIIYCPSYNSYQGTFVEIIDVDRSCYE